MDDKKHFVFGTETERNPDEEMRDYLAKMEDLKNKLTISAGEDPYAMFINEKTFDKICDQLEVKRVRGRAIVSGLIVELSRMLPDDYIVVVSKEMYEKVKPNGCLPYDNKARILKEVYGEEKAKKFLEISEKLEKETCPDPQDVD